MPQHEHVHRNRYLPGTHAPADAFLRVPVAKPPSAAGAGLGHHFGQFQIHAAPLAPQAKLAVNTPGDAYEQEADRVAEQVMRMEAPSGAVGATALAEERLQAKGTADPAILEQLIGGAGPAAQEEEVMRAIDPQAGMLIRRCSACGGSHKEEAGGSGGMCAECAANQKDDSLQAKETPGANPAVSAKTEASIRGMQGGGQPLDAETRAFMEPRFGHDFSQVRVHADSHAGATAQSVSARAFTVGPDIAFAPGEYQPGSTSGKQLLAHELTHVIQQAGSSIQRYPEPRVGALAHAHNAQIQRDLATQPPAVPAAPQPDLTEAQIREAIAFNRSRYDEQNTRLIQDLLGGPVTGSWTSENIVAIAATQEEYGLTKDGKVGADTFRFLNNEQTAEGMSTDTADCLTSFQALGTPANFQSALPASITGRFTTASQFSSRCNCSEFQYRQFIRGHARHIRGATVTDISGAFNQLPSGSLTAGFQEDGDTTDNPVNYGHRDQAADTNPEDRYLNDANAVDQANGCRYRSEDEPGLRNITGAVTGDVFDLDINFRGEIQRNGRPIQTKHWTAIRGRFTMP